jgi:hypothetical protein
MPWPTRSLTGDNATRTSITEICLDCGFTNRTHFNRVFRRWTDKSPRQYRNEFPAHSGGGCTERLAVAAKAFADQFIEIGQEIRAMAGMDFIHLDDSLAVPVPADLEGVSPFRRPGDQHVVFRMAEVDNARHLTPPEAPLAPGIGSSRPAVLSDVRLLHLPHIQAKRAQRSVQAIP